MKKKFYLLFLLLGICATSFAYDFEKDGIYYSFKTTVGSTEISVSVSKNEESGYSGDVSIPARVTYKGIDYDVIEIGDYAFKSSKLQSISMPETIVSIGNYAFSGCSNLTSVLFSKSLTTIGENAFEKCTSLQQVNLPNTVSKVGDGTFQESGLLSFTAPKDLDYLSCYMFSNCKNLQEVNLHDNIKKIGNCNPNISGSNWRTYGGSFASCKSLNNIKLPANLEVIGDDAFCSTSLENVEIPAGVRNIGLGAFRWNTKLKSINFPANIEYIGGGALNECKGLESVDLSHSTKLKFLYVGTFEDCTGLKQVKLPNSLLEISKDVVSYWGTFSGCISLEDIELPASLEVIGRDSFRDCNKIKRIVIPDNVRELDFSLFQGCSSLKSVVLGKGLTKVWTPFSDCPVLDEIYSLSETPVTDITFPEELYQNTKLYIPKGSASAYGVTLTGNVSAQAVTTGWTPFAHVYEIGTTGISSISTTSEKGWRIEDGQVIFNKDAMATVLDASGRQIYKGKAGRFTASQKGFYIIKIGNKASKVSL